MLITKMIYKKLKNFFFLNNKLNKNFKDDNLQFLENLNFEKFINSEMPECVFYELPDFLLESIKRNFKLDWKNVALSLNKKLLLISGQYTKK